MKFALFVVLSCLSVCSVSAVYIDAWGDTSALILDTKEVFVKPSKKSSFIEETLIFPKVKTKKNSDFFPCDEFIFGIQDTKSFKSNPYFNCGILFSFHFVAETIESPNHWHSPFWLFTFAGTNKSEFQSLWAGWESSNTSYDIATSLAHRFKVHFLHQRRKKTKCIKLKK